MAVLTLLDWCWTAFLLSLTTAVVRVTSQHPDVTTTRYHGDDESSDVSVTSSTPAQYVNPKPGRRCKIRFSLIQTNEHFYIAPYDRNFRGDGHV